MLVGYRTDDSAYVSHSGATFHPQDEAGGNNMAYYEINNTSDTIRFDISNRVSGLSNPVMLLHTHWGETDFTITDVGDQQTVLDEQAGFDNDIWFVDIGNFSGEFEIGSFDTGAGVTGTQAAWLPFVTVADLKV